MGLRWGLPEPEGSRTRRASVNANVLKISKITIHCCQLDREDRKWDPNPPKRVHVDTPWFHFAFAYGPGSRFAGRIDMDAWRERREAVPIERSRWTSFKRK